MSNFAVIVFVEFKKLFKSKIPMLTLLAVLMIPLMGGFFMYILKDPALAQKMGMISAKAQLSGTADWPSYLGLLAQAISIGGLIIFGFLSSWVFGREFSDRTIKDLLALPTSRSRIVVSKFVVILVWSLLLSAIVLILGLKIGNLIDIPGWSSELAKQGIATFISCALLTILLSTPIAFFACIGRGYLSPLGFLIFAIMMAQLVAATGYGQYFPWSIPALASGAAGEASAALPLYSIFIVLATSMLGLASTLLWWRYADHT